MALDSFSLSLIPLSISLLTLSSLGDERRTSERSIMVALLEDEDDDDDGEEERSRLEEEEARAAAVALDEEARVNIGSRRFSFFRPPFFSGRGGEGELFFFLFFCSPVFPGSNGSGEA